MVLPTPRFFNHGQYNTEINFCKSLFENSCRLCDIRVSSYFCRFLIYNFYRDNLEKYAAYGCRQNHGLSSTPEALRHKDAGQFDRSSSTGKYGAKVQISCEEFHACREIGRLRFPELQVDGRAGKGMRGIAEREACGCRGLRRR